MSVNERKAYINRFRLAVGLVIESKRAQGKQPEPLKAFLRVIDRNPEFFVYWMLKAVTALTRKQQPISRKNRLSRPPLNAEYLLYFFLRKEEREAVIGDLLEEHAMIQQRFSERRADIWFYKQVAASLWPLFQRAVLKIAGLVWLGRILRRVIS